MPKFLPIWFVFVLNVFLSGCSTVGDRRGETSSRTNQYAAVPVEFKRMPIMGRTRDGQDIHLGGFSGLVYLGHNPAQNSMRFLTLTDRGPNGFLKNASDDPKKWTRPFLMPKYNPRLVFFDYVEQQNKLSLYKQISLRDPNGQPLTGLPPASHTPDVKLEDAFDEQGRPHKKELLGIDPEGVAIDEKGNFWVCEEYRPSLMKFSPQGRLLKMYLPKGFYSEADLAVIKKRYGSYDFIKAILPEEYLHKKINRGFEGIAVVGGRVLAMMQSPVENESKGAGLVRWLMLDVETEVVSQYLYSLTNPALADKLGDISLSGGRVAVIEQNTEVGPKAIHHIYDLQLDFAQTSSISRLPEKSLMVDFSKFGIDYLEKLEGVAVLPSGDMAVVSDNDFGLKESPSAISIDANKKSFFLFLKKKGADAVR